MAPGASSHAVDLRAQIIENCEFYNGPHARISLVIAKEPLGTFKAIVLKTEDGVRDAVLSETAVHFYDALQALHVKSAEAVQNYISSNGFALVPSVKKRSAKLGVYGDGHESDSSTVTLDDCESLSDDETVSVTSVARAKRSRLKADKSAIKTSAAKHKTRQGRARSRSPSFSTSRARSRSSCSSSSDFDLHYDPPALPSRRPPFHNGFSQRIPPRPPQNVFSAFAMGHPHPPPPPPPPGLHTDYAAAMNYMPPPPPLAPAPAPAPAPFSFNKPPFNPTTTTTTTTTPITISPTTTNTTITPTPTPTSPATTNPLHHLQQQLNHQQNQPPLHDLILLIRWRHHGERRTLEQTTHISTRAIQQAALAFVRRQHASFANVPSPAQDVAAHHSALAGLRAAVRMVVVDGVAYDLSAWPGEDLGKVVAGLGCVVGGGGGRGGALLMFEVEVWNELVRYGQGGHGGHGQVNLSGRVVPTMVGSGSGSGVGLAGAGGSLPSMVVDVPGPGVPPRMVFPSVN